jgi:hypothetical protein
VGFLLALMTMVVGVPVAAVVLLGAIGMLAGRRLRQRRASSVEPYLLATCCACIGAVTYGVGVAYASFVHDGPDDAVCPAGRMESPSSRETLLPLTHDCLYADGRVIPLVPGLVSPLLLAAAISTIAFLGVGLYVGRRRRRMPGDAAGLPASDPT